MSDGDVGFEKRNELAATLSSRGDVNSLPRIDPEKLRARLYAKPDVHVNPQRGIKFTGRTPAQLKKVHIYRLVTAMAPPWEIKGAMDPHDVQLCV